MVLVGARDAGWFGSSVVAESARLTFLGLFKGQLPTPEPATRT